MSFSLSNLDLRYEPFPIGVARPIMGDEAYARHVDLYPPLELFQHIPKVGNKYCLSEKYNPAKYRQWVEDHACWREFHRWVKSPDFVFGVLDELARRSVDLGFKRRSAGQLVQRRLRSLLEGKWWQGEDRLSARFEFSMLPADGGSVTPHTDNPDKIITMVVSMARPGEWDPAHGGGTEVNRHRRPELSFNRVNGKAEFEDMEPLGAYEFEPNQCVVFVKTFNSWHCVRPMRGRGTTAMRRSLTINIELQH
jgi:2OG-Fe(II) oxygenase superfamily